MNLENTKEHLNRSIINIEVIIKNEKFPAYCQVERLLLETREMLNNEEFINSEKNLITCIRLLMEAPTKDKQLGLDTLTNVDKTYKLLKALRVN